MLAAPLSDRARRVDSAVFSVIVTTHRRPVELRRALSSVFSTNRTVSEVIVVDDLGAPETGQVIGEFSGKPLRYERRGGPPTPATSRNLGVELARGRYVVFLDDDDEFNQGYLDLLADELAGRGYPKFGYTDWIERKWSTQGGRANFTVTPHCIPDNHAIHVLVGNVVALNAAFIETDFARRFRFDEQLDTHEDWDWIIAVTRAHPAEHIEIFGPIVNTNAQGGGHRNTSGAHGKGPAFRKIFERWPLTDVERAAGLARVRVLVLADLGIAVGEGEV